jgi:hypothetical protein
MATILRDGPRPRYRDELEACIPAQLIIAALAASWTVARGRALNHFVTVMVIFFEMTGGLCGT